MSDSTSYEGITATAGFVTVYFTERVGGGLRFSSVRVPLVELLQEQVTDQMDRAVRRRLIQVWSEIDLSDPLF